MGRIINILFISAIVYISIKINSLFKPPPIPQLEDTWWGLGEPKTDDISVKPFTIDVPREVLDDLEYRFATARLTPTLEGISQEYGMNSKLLQEIVKFWSTKYDWREREKLLNQYPHFVTKIQGLQIHFVHAKAKVPAGSAFKVVPLLMLHGWPGSFQEFGQVIPLLTSREIGKDFVFEVVAPSLPGYGFSEGTSKPGLGAAEMAVIFKNLMKRLGFDQFYVHGGDWGAIIGSIMAVLYPDKVLGFHSNMCISPKPISTIKIFLGSFFPSLIVDKEYEDRIYPLSKSYLNLLSETGYLHLQATKPDTVGVALNDSPVGLAAYILEKFTVWTNPDWINREDGGLQLKYKFEDLLDNVMLYWITNSITTSMRLYAETFNKRFTAMGLESIPINVPSACAKFRNEISYQPDTVLKDRFHNLVQITHHFDGGHFPGMEVPEVLAKDIWSGISKMEELKKQTF